MNKAALIAAVTQQTGQDIKAVTDAVDAVLRTLVHTVASGEAVTITGLGTLEPVVRPGRTAYNPATGQPIQVPDKIRVRLRAADRFNDLVNGDLPLPATAAELRIKLPKSGRPRKGATAPGQGAA